MVAKINRLGHKYGRLTVVAEAEKRSGKVRWQCICECGNTHIASSGDLATGEVKSCGCLLHRMVGPDMTGLRFSRLSVVRFAGNRRRCAMWECLCDCGKTVVVQGKSLRSGNSKSCGCLRGESHGGTSRETKHPLYGRWIDIKKRCFNERHPRYKDYGGRGITMCDRWKNSFPAFAADIGAPPTKDHTIDRIDNDGDYCPENCRWATKSEQARNQRARTKQHIDAIKKAKADYWTRRRETWAASHLGL